jgi:hypothetical protein
MANSITNLTTSNTFLQWLTATQAVISRLNLLTEGGSGQTFVSNTNLEIQNNVKVKGDLEVTGNITLDAVGFDDLIVAGSGQFGTTLGVSGNTNLGSYATINYGNLPTANIVILTGSANTAIYSNITSQLSAGITANAAFIHANSGFIQANSGFIHANSAFRSQNTSGSYANSAFNTANVSFTKANSAFDAANTARLESVAFAIALG